ncbi:MAG: hypothetical protein QOF65_1813 [Thermoleophilaceae bacterium]|jgi:uncharacterized cupredoxin-like copper-binding protein|nr:hypothetical protein [Thermoleophilaceae bacterium]MEA2437257.1 hypothetical protein [Thermoleophilaceae bacterium]
MKPNVPAAALCAALAALAVAGCGSSDKKSSSSSSSSQPAPAPAPAPAKAGGGKSSNLTLAADSGGQLKFDKTTLKSKAGNVTITMDNPSPVQHAIGVRGNGVDKDGKPVGMGGKSSITVPLKPGRYIFYCPVDGHEAAGMKGILTVK